MNFIRRSCSTTALRSSLTTTQHPWKRTTGPTTCTITSVHHHRRKRLRTSHLIDDLLALSHPLLLGGLNILTWTPLIHLWYPLIHLGLRQACNRSVDLRIFQGQGEAGFHKRRNQDRGAT